MHAAWGGKGGGNTSCHAPRQRIRAGGACPLQRCAQAGRYNLRSAMQAPAGTRASCRSRVRLATGRAVFRGRPCPGRRLACGRTRPAVAASRDLQGQRDRNTRNSQPARRHSRVSDAGEQKHSLGPTRAQALHCSSAGDAQTQHSVWIVGDAMPRSARENVRSWKRRAAVGAGEKASLRCFARAISRSEQGNIATISGK